MRPRRTTGIPFLYAVASTTVGFSIYFAIGVIAEKSLGLTPLILLGAGAIFAITTMTYVEGGAMFRERGGSATFARHAFNELVSFIAGWAILIDYLIVIAAAAVSVPHYLTPVSDSLGGGAPSAIVAGAVVVAIAALNVRGITGRSRERRLVLIAVADLGLQVLIIAVGLLVAFDPSLLTAQLDLFETPSVEDLVTAALLSTIAFAGIEAASDLAPDLDYENSDLRRVISLGTILVPLLYAAVATVALMVVPVEPVPGGRPETELATTYVEEPVLGIVKGLDPALLADVMQWLVVIVAVPVLFWAANTSMLGLSRHVYVLATNRQIPSWLGKLHRRHATPYVAIGAAALIAIGLVIPGDIRLLAAIYAFGAILAVSIAHVSILRLRFTQPDRERPYEAPLNIEVAGRRLPLSVLFAAVVSIAAWIAVIVLQDEAFWIGGGWMLFGLVGYIVYRKRIERTSLFKRVTVPEAALKKESRPVEFGAILVPVFGDALDDDIVGTAGRLAAARAEEGERPPRLEILFVECVPYSLPLDAELPPEEAAKGERAVERAREVAEEYDGIEVVTTVVRGRRAQDAIVERARDGRFEVVVLGTEPPSRVRGGAIVGGIGGSRPKEITEVIEYVLTHAPCRVILTAPPA